MPTHHISSHSPIPQTQVDTLNVKEEKRKPITLNLMMPDQILSKLDDVENDVYSTSSTDDLPPSPAPFVYHSALERLYTATNREHPQFRRSTEDHSR